MCYNRISVSRLDKYQAGETICILQQITNWISRTVKVHSTLHSSASSLVTAFASFLSYEHVSSSPIRMRFFISSASLTFLPIPSLFLHRLRVHRDSWDIFVLHWILYYIYIYIAVITCKNGHDVIRCTKIRKK